MVRIRLKRMGRRKRPFYRIVVIDSRSRRDGREIERLGWFDPLDKENNIQIDGERSLHWLNNGAQPSDTVKNLFSKVGLSYKWHLTQQGKSEDEIEKELSELLAQRKSKKDEIVAKKEQAKAKIEKAEAEAKEEEKEQEESDMKSQQDTIEEASEPAETTEEQKADKPEADQATTEKAESVEEDSSK